MDPTPKLMSLARIIIPSAIMTLSACTATVDTGPTRPPGPSRPQMCTMEHAPVCGQRGNQSRTFSNACLARSEGFRVMHDGQCRASSMPCTREFQPVCARQGSRTRTFDNSCLARSAGFTVQHRGECMRFSPGPAPAACPMIEAPVCAARGNRTRSFANECMARAEGYRTIRPGNCR